FALLNHFTVPCSLSITFYVPLLCDVLFRSRDHSPRTKSRTTNQGAARAVTDKLVAKTEQAFTVYTFRSQTLCGIFRRPSGESYTVRTAPFGQRGAFHKHHERQPRSILANAVSARS